MVSIKSFLIKILKTYVAKRTTILIFYLLFFKFAQLTQYFDHRLFKFSLAILDMMMEGTVSQIF